MEAEVKLIPDDQFLELAQMYLDMSKSIPYSVSIPYTLYILTKSTVEKTDFTALGLYENKQLVGFTSGYAVSKETFYFSGIYVKVKYKNTRLLVEKSIEYVKNKGYSIIESDCNNSNISSILEKYGAKPLYIKYRKDFRDG